MFFTRVLCVREQFHFEESHVIDSMNFYTSYAATPRTDHGEKEFLENMHGSNSYSGTYCNSRWWNRNTSIESYAISNELELYSLVSISVMNDGFVSHCCFNNKLDCITAAFLLAFPNAFSLVSLQWNCESSAFDTDTHALGIIVALNCPKKYNLFPGCYLNHK